MNKAMEVTTEHPVARPLRVLVPLITEDLKKAYELGVPYYKAAGEKMLEAKAQLKHGEFGDWLKRHFTIGARQASEYMALARTTNRIENGGAMPFSSLREHVQKTRNPNYGKAAPWQQEVREAIGRVNVDALRQSELKRVEERELQRKLALQLIDIGFKALATKLHPDRGGSRDAMARLNQVRDRLKGCA